MSRFLAALVGAAISMFLLSSSAFSQDNRTTLNKSATIATGNTFQTVLAAGTPWSVTIENNNASDNCWIQFGVGVTAANATKAKSILLLPGGSWARYYPYVPSDEIEATCASNGDTLYIDIQ